MTSLKDKLNSLSAERQEKILLRVKDLITHELAMQAFNEIIEEYSEVFEKLANN